MDILSSLPLVGSYPIAGASVVTALLAVLFYAGSWLKEDLTMRQKFNKLPGIPYMGLAGHLALGNVDLLFYNMSNIKNINVAVFQALASIHSLNSIRKLGFTRFQVGFDRMVALFDAKAVEQLVTSNANIQKARFYNFFHRWLGRGLLTSTGNKWRKHRKILTPAFHFRILDSFVPIMNENCNELVDLVQKAAPTGMDSATIDVRSYVTNCTLDTICETAMGVRVGAQSGDLKYVAPLNQSLEMLMKRILNPLHHIDKFYDISANGKIYSDNLNEIHTFVNTVIRNRKTEMEPVYKEMLAKDSTQSGEDLLMGNRKRYAFLDSLLMEHFKDPKGFTMTDIQDEVNTFMFEGHDTTSIGLIFALQLIGNDQKVQDKIYEELESIFGDEMSRSISTEDCRQMKYLEMCIKEALRLFPPVPFFARKIEQDFQVGSDENNIVPTGSQCVVFAYFLHRDPTVFPQPERYIPERFEPNAEIHRMPYAYVPFSAGPRNCIGQKFALLEMKIMIASILRKFRMVSITQRDQIDVEASILIKTPTPIRVRFEQRN